MPSSNTRATDPFGLTITTPPSNKLPVFMWRSHIPKFNIAFLSEVLVSSDYRHYRNLAFYNVLAWQGTFEFASICVAWLKWLPEKAVAWVKEWVIALVFANWKILALEEIFISTCRSSRVISLRFNSTTKRQMFIISLIRDFIYWMATILRFDHMIGENQEIVLSSGCQDACSLINSFVNFIE